MKMNVKKEQEPEVVKKIREKKAEIMEEVAKAMKDIHGFEKSMRIGLRIEVYMNRETGEIGSSGILTANTGTNPNFYETHVHILSVRGWCVDDYDNISAENPQGEEKKGHYWNDANEEWEREELLVNVIADEETATGGFYDEKLREVIRDLKEDF